MSELENYLREYIKGIDDIIEVSQGDEGKMRDAARNRWGKHDPRYLVFCSPSYRFPKLPLDDTGTDMLRDNELPHQGGVKFSQPTPDDNGSEGHRSSEKKL